MRNLVFPAIFLAGLSSANPLPQGASQPTLLGPYKISGFEASKGHLSGYCRFNFDVSAPALSTPAHCSAYLDAGSSSATWLAYVYEGAGNCSDSAVTWTFYQPANNGVSTAATFNVTVGGEQGTYVVPAEHITVWLNDAQNPYDNDVAYTGPKEFEITEFKQ